MTIGRRLGNPAVLEQSLERKRVDEEKGPVEHVSLISDSEEEDGLKGNEVDLGYASCETAEIEEGDQAAEKAWAVVQMNHGGGLAMRRIDSIPKRLKTALLIQSILSNPQAATDYFDEHPDCTENILKQVVKASPPTSEFVELLDLKEGDELDQLETGVRKNVFQGLRDLFDQSLAGSSRKNEIPKQYSTPVTKPVDINQVSYSSQGGEQTSRTPNTQNRHGECKKQNSSSSRSSVASSSDYAANKTQTNSSGACGAQLNRHDPKVVHESQDISSNTSDSQDVPSSVSGASASKRRRTTGPKSRKRKRRVESTITGFYAVKSTPVEIVSDENEDHCRAKRKKNKQDQVSEGIVDLT
mmetsp:Transcript_3503/g.5060  ORF Transcript_3503/g.5060 Transcript_3503/m.5060 type:complete len:356 (+) Transcript_3503:170-1237(+)|eukprot:CAMPEP_0203751512 /NCGR_PEP_ID=MMETSP0098-20131031/5571_1 /ASSEMBLY_ACC=CAM_ASM_000208 /TAXON_ID=96639 /ORGANISM=" , Strain NY0313808BC1" /LENGTH=355 /DNA_ID=CAMNT_0050641257 /DNA_START=93 /DNA_END=1160 /DNA_ORIENTATION=-